MTLIFHFTVGGHNHNLRTCKKKLFQQKFLFEFIFISKVLIQQIKDIDVLTKNGTSNACGEVLV